MANAAPDFDWLGRRAPPAKMAKGALGLSIGATFALVRLGFGFSDGVATLPPPLPVVFEAGILLCGLGCIWQLYDNVRSLARRLEEASARS